MGVYLRPKNYANSDTKFANILLLMTLICHMQKALERLKQNNYIVVDNERKKGKKKRFNVCLQNFYKKNFELH